MFCGRGDGRFMKKYTENNKEETLYRYATLFKESENLYVYSKFLEKATKAMSFKSKRKKPYNKRSIMRQVVECILGEVFLFDLKYDYSLDDAGTAETAVWRMDKFEKQMDKTKEKRNCFMPKEDMLLTGEAYAKSILRCLPFPANDGEWDAESLSRISGYTGKEENPKEWFKGISPKKANCILEELLDISQYVIGWDDLINYYEKDKLVVGITEEIGKECDYEIGRIDPFYVHKLMSVMESKISIPLSVVEKEWNESEFKIKDLLEDGKQYFFEPRVRFGRIIGLINDIRKMTELAGEDENEEGFLDSLKEKEQHLRMVLFVEKITPSLAYFVKMINYTVEKESELIMKDNMPYFGLYVCKDVNIT